MYNKKDIPLMQQTKYPSFSYRSKILTSSVSFIDEMKRHFGDEIKEGDRVHIYSLLAIFLIAAAIRIYLIFFKMMELDEGVSAAWFIMGPLSFMLTFYNTNNHVFHNFLAHITSRIFGIEPWAIRLPALIAGILIVPASYLFVRSFYNKYAALLTAAFVASSDPLVYYSLSARGYSLMILFFLLVFVIGAHLKQDKNLSLWLSFAIFSALGFYTIPIMLYPFGIVIIWLFLSVVLKDANPSQYQLKDLFVSAMIVVSLTLILYSPFLIGTDLKSLNNAPLDKSAAAPKDWAVFVPNILQVVSSTWKDWNEGIPVIVSFVMVIGFVISLFSHKQLSRYRVPVFWASVIWIIPLLLIHRAITNNRFWLFLLPLYLGMASSGIYYLLAKLIEPRYRNFKSIVFSVLSIILVLSLGLGEVQARKNAYYERKGTLIDPDYTTLFLKNNLAPGDRIIFFDDVDVFNIEYHFILHKLPLTSWTSDPKSARRLLVYINYPNRKIEGPLRYIGLALADYSVPKILFNDEYATIYELTKMKER